MVLKTKPVVLLHRSAITDNPLVEIAKELTNCLEKLNYVIFLIVNRHSSYKS